MANTTDIRKSLDTTPQAVRRRLLNYTEHYVHKHSVEKHTTKSAPKLAVYNNVLYRLKQTERTHKEALQLSVNLLLAEDRRTYTQHRHPKWARYLVNALKICSVVPGLLESAYSYHKYHSWRFWKPTSELLKDESLRACAKLGIVYDATQPVLVKIPRV